jgi:hypothetical protein
VRNILALVIACLAAAVAGARAQDAGTPLDLPAYVARLDEEIARVAALRESAPREATSVVAKLPRTWRVRTPELSADVDTDWLRRDLHAWQQAPALAAREAILVRLRAMRHDAASALEPVADVSVARTEMQRILDDPSFRGARGPSWFDRMQQRVLRFLQRLLFGAVSSSIVPSITTFAVYALVAVVAVLVALRITRRLRRQGEADLALAAAVPAQARPVADWLSDARVAAAEGDWARAVRCAYWCGIAHLEGQGAWRPDRSRTPREYLRLMPDASPQAAPLRALTRLLERVWYAADRADESRYEQALQQLKELGCLSS